MIKKSIIVLVLFHLMLSCTHNQELKETNLLIIGDVQLKSNLKYYSESEWTKQRLDTAQFSAVFKDVLERETPDYILQTGDWVNYNNNLFLEIQDTIGNHLKHLPLPYNEWEFMNSSLPKYLQDRFYMAIGNHESYEKIVLQGMYVPDIKVLANIKETKFDMIATEEKKELLIHRFPHLKNAKFHQNTGTYIMDNDAFTLLSFDGLDKDKNSLLTFIEDELRTHRNENKEKPILVISHYPIFTGRANVDDEKLVLKNINNSLISIFDKYKIDLFINGHEHFYLRYKKQGLEDAQFDVNMPTHTTYMTISNFANPYGREFKRLNPNQYDSNSLIYFNGIHYTTIKIREDQVEVITFGYDSKNNIWNRIDQFYLK